MSNMQLQVSPLSPSFANVSRVQQESSSSSNSMALDSPTLNIRNNKAVRFAGDGNGLMENRLVSAIETLTTLSRKQNDVLTYISKLEEDQLTLTHERVRGERTASILSARIYNSQMVQQANQLQSEYDSAPLAAVPNHKGVYPSHAKLPPIDSTSSLIRLNHGALKEYLTFYGITPPVVYLQPTKEREAGAMRLFLAKHIGCYGLHGTGKNATEFGASE